MANELPRTQEDWIVYRKKLLFVLRKKDEELRAAREELQVLTVFVKKLKEKLSGRKA